MDSKFSLLLSLLCFIARLRFSFLASGETSSFESVPDLEKSMYTQIEGFPCVRLLDLSGEIGCSNPGRGNVVAPIVGFSDTKELMAPAAILVSPDEFESSLLRMFQPFSDAFVILHNGILYCICITSETGNGSLILDNNRNITQITKCRVIFIFFSLVWIIIWERSMIKRVLNDSDFAKNVAGILVESGTRVQNSSKGFSPDLKFPQAEFAPYRSNKFEWNPAGSGLMWKAYNFPIFLLSMDSTLLLQKVFLMNEKNKKSNTKVVSEFDLVMQTTKSGTRDSDSCLKERTCLPLGGYSVWSALPPINISSPLKSKPTILAMTSMDSASFFRDKSLGAESPISGLIALLAVVDALSHLDRLEELNKQLVFVVLTGEAWGYLGSRRFFLESDKQSDTMKGFDLSMLETVLEIGSVGKSPPQGTKTFFAHTAGVTSSVNETLHALQHAQESLVSESIMVKTASSSNPGVPPSSLMTFLRMKPQISGLVLEDFDSTFSNEFYHSHLDDLSNINSSSIVAAASLVARTLYILAGGKDTLAINSIKINSSLVEQLIGCLLSCEPGLSCGLVKHYISPSTTCPSHYVGVILGEPSSDPYPAYAGDISRFVWNFLADKTSISSKNGSSSCPKDCTGVDHLCIRKEADGKGVCVISTTRYVPSYSTRLSYNDESGTWTVLPSNSSDIMSLEDPVWTESNWDTINLRVYKVQTAAYDRLILLSGILVTLFAYLVIVIARTLIRKALKQD